MAKEKNLWQYFSVITVAAVLFMLKINEEKKTNWNKAAKKKHYHFFDLRQEHLQSAQIIINIAHEDVGTHPRISENTFNLSGEGNGSCLI